MKITVTTILFLIFFGACSEIPDLQEPGILKEAIQEAIPLGQLERKLMYGMFPLYVDIDEDPYTGWIKEIDPETKAKTLGYLKTGRKEGRWVTWAENGTKILEAMWAEDRLEGIYLAWYNHGTNRVKGQTRDGEMDGEWLEFYQDGQISRRSQHQLGKFLEVEVWKPDGTICKDSVMKDGNGSFFRYDFNGSVKNQTFFLDGARTEIKEF